MKKILKKSLHILCTTLGIIPFMLTSCNYLAVDEYFNDLTPLDSIFARQDYLERYVWGTAALMPAQGNLFSGSYGPYETAVDEVLLSWQKAEYAGTYLYADKLHRTILTTTCGDNTTKVSVSVTLSSPASMNAKT